MRVRTTGPFVFCATARTMPASFALSTLALRAILALSPLGAPREVLPGWDESQEARWHRMRSIASDIADAAAEACAGRADDAGRDRCERWSVAGLVGIAKHESDFAPDVDAGNCHRGPGHERRCNGDHTIWQIRVGGEEAALYRRDRRAAAREALRRMSRSMNACRRLPPELMLTAYAGGRCVTDGDAAKRSRELWALVVRAEMVGR